MDADTFYHQIVEIAALPSDERYQALSTLHSDIFTRYLATLQAITAESAARIVADGRTVNQVIGHIAEWERYCLISIGEVIAGVEWPGLLSHARYVEPDGMVFAFKNNDKFNARQSDKYAVTPWDATQTIAIDTATTSHRLWTQSGLLTPERLERTRSWDYYSLPTGVTLRQPCGWFLWMMILEHEEVEHAADLALGRSCM